MKVLPAFRRDAAWDIARLYMTWQVATKPVRGHHADKKESECNEHDDDSHCLRRMDRHIIRPFAREPTRGGWVLHSNSAANFLKGRLRGEASQFHDNKLCLHFILKKKEKILFETVAPRWSVFRRTLYSRVQYLKQPLFGGLAFARVIVLNIRKPNGVCCPGCSPRL